jgi:hypothetical protein
MRSSYYISIIFLALLFVAITFELREIFTILQHHRRGDLSPSPHLDIHTAIPSVTATSTITDTTVGELEQEEEVVICDEESETVQPPSAEGETIISSSDRPLEIEAIVPPTDDPSTTSTPSATFPSIASMFESGPVEDAPELTDEPLTQPIKMAIMTPPWIPDLMPPAPYCAQKCHVIQPQSNDDLFTSDARKFSLFHPCRNQEVSVN